MIWPAKCWPLYLPNLITPNFWDRFTEVWCREESSYTRGVWTQNRRDMAKRLKYMPWVQTRQDMVKRLQCMHWARKRQNVVKRLQCMPWARTRHDMVKRLQWMPWAQTRQDVAKRLQWMPWAQKLPARPLSTSFGNLGIWHKCPQLYRPIKNWWVMWLMPRRPPSLSRHVSW